MINWKFWKAIPLPTRNVSEPVTSFLKCFRDNPKRFKLDQTQGWRYGTARFSFSDKQTGEEWGVQAYMGMFDDGNGISLRGLPQWLTDDEATVIEKFMINHYTERAKKLKTIREQRSNRHLVNERKRLINVYCK